MKDGDLTVFLRLLVPQTGLELDSAFSSWHENQCGEKKPCKRHHTSSSIKHLTTPTGVSTKSSFSHLIRHNACPDNTEAPREHRKCWEDIARILLTLPKAYERNHMDSASSQDSFKEAQAAQFSV